MAYSVLREDQYRVIGKTTGTDARMLYWFYGKGISSNQKPQGANIGEQQILFVRWLNKKQMPS